MTKRTTKPKKLSLKEKVDLIYSCFHSEEHLSRAARAQAIKEGNLEEALEYDHCNRTMTWVLESMDYILEHGKIR